MKFRQKNFGKLKTAKEFIKKNPALPISAGTLLVSSANLATNTSRHRKDREYQERQLKAMENLTQAMSNTTNSMDRVNKSIEESGNNSQARRVLILKPRPKMFSIETGGYKNTTPKFRATSQNKK